MNNLDAYNSIFIDIFQTEEKHLNETFNAENIEKWDSVCQLSLATSIEDTFDIMMEPDDIIGFKSYELGKTILEKYDIEIEQCYEVIGK